MADASGRKDIYQSALGSEWVQPELNLGCLLPDGDSGFGEGFKSSWLSWQVLGCSCREKAALWWDLLTLLIWGDLWPSALFGRNLQGKMQHLSPAWCFGYVSFGSRLKTGSILLCFLLTSILCLVSQKPGIDGCIPFFPAGAVLKFAACHGPVLPALVPMGMTLHCTSQNLLNFIFTLTIQISSRANVSDCTSTSSWCVLKCAQQLWSCVEEIIPASAFEPCQASCKENRSTMLFTACI